MQKSSQSSSAAPGVALIVGGGPGISASCARLFASKGLRVAVAARDPDKPVMRRLELEFGAQRFACDASDEGSVAALFDAVSTDLDIPRLVVHNIDGRSMDVFRKTIDEVDPALVRGVLDNSAYSAFLTGQQAARRMLQQAPDSAGRRGTIIFTNASAALKGFPRSAAFAMACHAKAGLTESMARELMPQGIHVAQVPIDGAVGWEQEDGSRQHRLAGTDENDNLLHPDHIAQAYWMLHEQHRSTWASEIVLRPWVENW